VAEGAQATATPLHDRAVPAIGVFSPLGFCFRGRWRSGRASQGADPSVSAGFNRHELSVRANLPRRRRRRNQLAAAFDLAFASGAVTGLLFAKSKTQLASTFSALLAILDFSLAFLAMVFADRIRSMRCSRSVSPSLISIFARLGGRSSPMEFDVGAALRGKVRSACIPETILANPATIRCHWATTFWRLRRHCSSTCQTYAWTSWHYVLASICFEARRR